MNAQLFFSKWSALLLAAAICTGCAGMKSAEQKPFVDRSQVRSETATVEAVDADKRQVTLKGADGNSTTLDVSEEVRNLPQVQVGDQVVVDYVEALAVSMAKHGSEPSITEEQAAERAQPGEKPGAAGARRVTVVAVIDAIDQTKPSVTLRGPEGNSVEVKVQDPEVLKKVNVGDSVAITYTQALAVAVRKP